MDTPVVAGSRAPSSRKCHGVFVRDKIADAEAFTNTPTTVFVPEWTVVATGGLFVKILYVFVEEEEAT